MRKIHISKARKICKLFKYTDEDLSTYTNGKTKPAVVKSVAQYIINNLSVNDVKKLHEVIGKMK